MNKELPINDKPFIRAFPQYAFLDAIANNANTNDRDLCKLHVDNFCRYKWNFDFLNAEFTTSDCEISIKRQGYGAKPTGGFFCDYSEHDEMVFNVQYMQYTNIWDRIVFFCEVQEPDLLSKDIIHFYEFGIYCCGALKIDNKGENLYYKDNKNEGKLPQWYKIRLVDHKIGVYVSCSGRKWVHIHTCSLANESKVKFMGFHIDLYENQYHKWICNNFIQIKYDRTGGKPVDYVGFMNRDWVNYAIHPIVKFSYDKKEIIKDRGLWRYILENISNGRYLEIWLDEYYIKGLLAFKKYSYIHQSLIYGIDKKEKNVKMMSFKEGKPILVEVSLRILSKAWSNVPECNRAIELFEFLPSGCGYLIDIKHIYNQLGDYLSGRNSSEDFQYIAEKECGNFGIGVYNEILNDLYDSKLFLDDVRIAYLLKEHKECMLFRIDYLFEYGVISKKKYLYMKTKISDIVNIAKVVLGLVIKNKIHNIYRIQDKIGKYLCTMRELESECYPILQKELDAHIQKQGATP